MRLFITAFAIVLYTFALAHGLDPRTSNTATPPTSYGIVLFPAFQALDVFGPLNILNSLALQRPLRLSLLSSTLDPVSTKPTAMNTSGSNFGESVVPTHTFDAPPEDLEVLFVPEGIGTRREAIVAPAVEFVSRVYPCLMYLVSVCTGATIVAKTGVLDWRRATTNKRAWAWATAQGPNIDWVPQARWVVDGNIWTSSGVSAGIDVAYAFVAALYGDEVADGIANSSEYVRRLNPDYDPFAAIWNVTK